MKTNRIAEVAKRHTSRLMALKGVVGVGQGLCEGQPCLRVFVAQKTDALVDQIPSELEGCVVEVVETGEFSAGDPG